MWTKLLGKTEGNKDFQFLISVLKYRLLVLIRKLAVLLRVATIYVLRRTKTNISFAELKQTSHSRGFSSSQAKGTKSISFLTHGTKWN